MAVKPLAIKVAAGVIGVGGASVIGHQTYKALQNKPEVIDQLSNRNRLTSEKYQLLGKEQDKDGTWTEILNSYREVIKTKTELAFLDFDGNVKVGQEAPKILDTLKTKCEESLNSKDETLLNKARKWCIVPITVEKALEGRKILRTDNSKDKEEDQQEWNQKIKDYTKKGNDNKIKNLNLGETAINAPTPENRNLIRQKCKELSVKKSYEADYEEALKNSQDWCSIEQGTS